MKKNVKKLIKREELSRISGVKETIIAKYIKQGLLKCSKEGKDYTRYFEKRKALKRLKEIEKMDKDGYRLSEIRDRLQEVRPIIIQGDDSEIEELFKDKKEKQAYINYMTKKMKKKAKKNRLPYCVIELSKEEVSKNFKDFLKKRRKN